MIDSHIQAQLARIKPMVHLPIVEYGSVPTPVPAPVNSQRFCSAFFQNQLGWMLVGRNDAQEQAARNMCNALCYTNADEITILEFIDQMITIQKIGMFVNYGMVDRLDMLRIYKSVLLEYADDWLYKKHRLFEYRYAKSNAPWQKLSLGFSPLGVALHDIIKTERVRNYIGDRIRYINPEAEHLIFGMGIRPKDLADKILEHTHRFEIDISKFDNARNRLINQIAKGFLPFYDRTLDGSAYSRRFGLVSIINIYCIDNINVDYDELKWIWLGLYFTSFSQWIENIQTQHQGHKVKIHIDELVSRIYRNSNWWDTFDPRQHPKITFQKLIAEIAEERVRHICGSKHPEYRLRSLPPNVREIVTGEELVSIGDRMGICIGGAQYLKWLQGHERHFLILGETSKPDQCIIAHIRHDSRIDRYTLIEAVTRNNRIITETHVRYGDWERVKQTLQLLPPTRISISTDERAATLPQAVVSLMYPSYTFLNIFNR